VDSFCAVRTVVYEQGGIAITELIAALQADFAGYEALRELLLTAPPKYGRDDDTADDVAAAVVEAFCGEIDRHRNARGGRFAPGLWSFTQNVGIGSRTAASPDGRHAGSAISHSMDPVAGQALAGPTAVLRSAAKLDQTRLANGGSLLLEFAESTLAEPASRLAALSLCEGYLRMGGIEIQLSCASVERLLAAQRNPEAYRDLVVRIAGYSDFFVRVCPELQRTIIEREKHIVSR
jgi:formate C-acetyltransferase